MSERPPLAVRVLDRCLVCGEVRFTPLALAYAFRGRRFPAVQCGGCGMRFLSVQPAPEAFAELYGAEYFERDFRCGRSDAHSFAEDAFRGENTGLLDAFAALGPPGRLLEVGCASGWLLKHAADRGWRAHGVELSSEAVAHARAIGAEVFHGDLLDAALPESSFDLVYMGDVLEHVPDCRRVLAEVARVLVPGGHLYLRGPTTTNSLGRRLGLALYRMAGRTIVLREPPYHLWEFTPRSMRHLAAVSGLEVVKILEGKIAPGSPRGTKSGPERALLRAIDVVNVPVTRAFNAFGDRIVLIARRPRWNPKAEVVFASPQTAPAVSGA